MIDIDIAIGECKRALRKVHRDIKRLAVARAAATAFWQRPPWITEDGTCTFRAMAAANADGKAWPWTGEHFLAILNCTGQRHPVLREIVDGSLQEPFDGVWADPASVEWIARIPAPPEGDRQ